MAAALPVAQLNEAIFVLAGERFLAARLRPKVGRGGTVGPEPFPTDGDKVDEDETDGESAAPEETEPQDSPVPTTFPLGPSDP